MHALAVLASLTATIAAPLVLATPANAAVPDAARCLVAAHRGLTNAAQTTATENTLTTMHRAVSVGADIIETDVAATSDDSIVAMHDATVDRTTKGTGPVRLKTLAQVKALTTEDGKSGRFTASGTPIPGPGGVPRLSDVVAYAKSVHKPLMVETKTPGGTAWWNRLATNVKNYPGGVILESFDRADMDKARTLMPGVPVELIASTQPPVVDLAGLNGVVIEKSVLTTDYRAALDGANLQIYPWVEDTSSLWQRDLGHTSSVLTNRPGSAVAFRKTDAACPQFTG